MNSKSCNTVIPSYGRASIRLALSLFVLLTVLCPAYAQRGLATWGNNSQGQLGRRRTFSSTLPLVVPSLSSVVKVSAGTAHTLALRADGTVWAWGWNVTGQLGNGIAGVAVSQGTPAQVSGISNAVAIAAGAMHSLALRSDGTVWAWGQNGNGELGIGVQAMGDFRSTPVQVNGLTNVSAIAAGGQHSIALRADGTVWTWGSNANGQLGDGTSFNNRATAAQVAGLSGIVAIAAGLEHTLALKNDGTVWVWGYNFNGQLGDNSNIDRLTPVQLTNLTGVVAIVGGGYSSLALKNDGTAWAWGRNDSGQLGDGTTTERKVPTRVSGLTGVVALSSRIVRGFAMMAHSMALKTDGTVWTWGSNALGQLGNGSTTSSLTPVRVSGLTGVTAIAEGDTHSLAVKNDGTVWAWGDNAEGQLGDGSILYSPTPAASELQSLISVSARGGHTLALRADGRVLAWGENSFGQLGDGTTTSRATPLAVNGLTDVVAIAGGRGHSLALKSDGTVRAWGYNGNGQLGDGTTTRRTTPVAVSGLTNVTAIAAGHLHSLALKADGTVWLWGNPGLVIETHTPIQVSGLTNVTAIAVGGSHSLALKSDGTVWAWGRNDYGQLGNGTVDVSTSSLTPQPVSGLNGVRTISAGFQHNLVVRQDGTVWAWGWNSTGQLGDGTFTNRGTPVAVSGLTGVARVAAGGVGSGDAGSHSLALKSDGTVWAWGMNSSAQLGDGEPITQSPYGTPTPEPVSGVAGAVSIAAGDQHSLVLVRKPAVDFNKDSYGDILFRNTTTGANLYWTLRNAQRTGYGTLNTPLVPASWRLAAAFDSDQDGDTDMVWQNTATGDVVSWKMRDRVFESWSYLAREIPAGWLVVGVFDVNGDGQTDLVWHNTTTGDVLYWRMLGPVRLGWAYIVRGVPQGWEVVATPDLDGDGEKDLIWQHRASGVVAFWRIQNGVRVSYSTLAEGVPSAWRVVGSMDVNDDGYMDLLWQNQTAGEGSYWIMKKLTRQSYALWFTGVPSAWQLVVPR